MTVSQRRTVSRRVDRGVLARWIAVDDVARAVRRAQEVVAGAAARDVASGVTVVSFAMHAVVAEWEPILELARGAGVSAVCRDPDGSLWLVHDLAGLGRNVDDEDLAADEGGDPRDVFGELLWEFEIAGLDVRVDGVAALAGRLPPEASCVDVRDVTGQRCASVTGEGAWLALPAAPGLDSTTLVFRDAAGHPVRGPLPENTELQALADLDEPCPICGAASWLLATGDEVDDHDAESTGGGRAAICAACGVHVPLPVVVQAAPLTIVRRAPAAAREHARETYADRQREKWDTYLAGLGERPFSSAGDVPEREYMSGYSGGSHAAPSSVTLSRGRPRVGSSSPWIDVTSTRNPWNHEYDPPARWIAMNLESLLTENTREHTPAADVRAALSARRAKHVIGALTPTREPIEIDGEPVVFLTLDTGDMWCAFAELDRVSVTIVANGVPRDNVRLQRAELDSLLEPPPQTSC